MICGRFQCANSPSRRTASWTASWTGGPNEVEAILISPPPTRARNRRSRLGQENDPNSCQQRPRRIPSPGGTVPIGKSSIVVHDRNRACDRSPMPAHHRESRRRQSIRWGNRGRCRGRRRPDVSIETRPKKLTPLLANCRPKTSVNWHGAHSGAPGARWWLCLIKVLRSPTGSRSVQFEGSLSRVVRYGRFTAGSLVRKCQISGVLNARNSRYSNLRLVWDLSLDAHPNFTHTHLRADWSAHEPI